MGEGSFVEPCEDPNQFRTLQKFDDDGNDKNQLRRDSSILKNPNSVRSKSAFSGGLEKNGSRKSVQFNLQEGDLTSKSQKED